MKNLVRMFLTVQLSSMVFVGSGLVGCGSNEKSKVISSEKTREQLQAEADAQAEMAKEPRPNS